MAKISAFVGHSFLPEDEAVVRTFTDFFDLIAKSHDFEWVHATEPRPELVDAKVLELMEGRNLFIGICTPNERVAKDSRFSKAFFGDKLVIKNEDLEFKTSDWIIQEIGLAIGRSMKIIILLQDGVRGPGSLQGNIEYIRFDRNDIDKSFRTILGMITGLQNSGVAARRNADAPTSGKSSDEDREAEVVDSVAEEPNQTWDENKFDFEYFKAVILDKAERADQISSAWFERFGSDKESAEVWKASCLRYKTLYSDENHLSALISIADEYPDNPRILQYVAHAHEYFEDYERARDSYRAALSKIDEISEKRKTLGDLAKVLQSLGDNKGVASVVEDMRALVKSPEDECSLLSKLEGLEAWHGDNKMLKLALMEREVEIAPSDTHKRFQLAYAHSQSDNERLTLFHYERIPYAQRDAMVWNNMGVAYQGFSLPGLAVSAYQRSANEGETLAMSNLAEILMSAGFLKEAEKELQRAKESTDVHNNVAKSEVRLNSIPAEEEENRTKKLQGASELSKFLAKVGHKLWQPTPSEMGRTWSGEEVTLAVSMSGHKVTAKGSFERTQTGNGLVAALQGKEEKTVDTFDVIISGQLVGSVLVGEYVTERRKNPLRSMGILDLNPNKRECVAIFDAEQRSLRCLIDKTIKEFKVQD